MEFLCQQNIIKYVTIGYIKDVFLYLHSIKIALQYIYIKMVLLKGRIMNEIFNAKGESVKELGGAKYIKATEKAPDYSLYDPLPRFRREIEINEDVKSAEIVVQSPSFAQFFINGENITDDIFISAISDYRKILWYNTYDVTSLIKKGKNAFSVICGNGFLNESFHTPWIYEIAPWRDAPQFILSLKVNGKIVLVSDENWRVDRKNTHIIYSHIRSGEYVDMRKYDDSWKNVGYDDSAWDNVICRNYPFDAKFMPIDCQPVREIERIKAKSITKTAKGYLVDFGLNSSGYVEIALCEKAGEEVVLKFCEEVTSNGEDNHMGNDKEYFYPDKTPYHVCKVITSGKRDVFKPSFTYFGFRYLIVENVKNEVKHDDVCAIFIHQDIKRTASFKCGNDVINYIYTAGMRSCYSNMFWCMTDCPTREKLGWMNDAQATCEHALINFDMRKLYKKWFEDIKAGMREDGALTGVIPSPEWGYDWGPVCDCMLYELPYRFYMYTGDDDMLKSGIEYFDRYIGYLEKALKDGYDFILGDWLGNGSNPNVPKQFTWEFYLIKAYTVTAFAYERAGKDNSAHTNKLEQLRKAFIEKYICKDSKCAIEDQTSVSMMIMGGLYTDKNVVCNQLASLVENGDGTLKTGMVGVQYIYDALSVANRPDLAFKLITQSSPGYRNWFENGATTLWELWDGKEKYSHNHHMFSAVIGWFFKSLLGIHPKLSAPAFEEVELAPRFVKEIGFVQGEMQTTRGKIVADWKYDNGKFVYNVKIPVGVTGIYNGKKLSSGNHEFIIKE